MLIAAFVFGCTGSSVGLMTPLLPALCFQLDMSPGYCWRLKESQSQVVFNLPTKVQPTAVTVQHSVETNLWHVSSAPRDFAVFVSVCWYMGLGCGCRETPLLGDILEKRTSTSLEQCSRETQPHHILHQSCRSCWSSGGPGLAQVLTCYPVLYLVGPG